MTDEKIYLQEFETSVRELIRIGLRNKWIDKNALLRLVDSETERPTPERKGIDESRNQEQI